MKNIYLFGFLFLLLISCTSCSKKENTLSKKAERTIVMLEQLQEKGQISEIECKESSGNVIQYDNKGFFGKYWFGAIFLVYFFVTLSIMLGVSGENLDRAEPLSSKGAYVAWLFSGLWGGYWIYLGNRNESDFIKLWKWISSVAIPILFISNYTAIMYFLNTPSMLFFHVDTWSWNTPNSLQLYYSCWAVIILFIINVIGGLLFIPYITYAYNGYYFRQHYENDRILNGEEVESDRFYKRLVTHIHSLTENIEEINTSVKEDYTLEDPDKDNSFWGSIKRGIKNVVTGFNSGKLEKELDRLRLLCTCCQNLEEDISNTEYYNDELYSFLEKARSAAYRNLFLAKELIGVVKNKISSEQQKLLVDEFIQVDTPLNHSNGVCFRASDIQFNSDNFFSAVSTDMSGTLKGLTKQMEKEKNLSKADFISAGIEAGISSAIHGISNIINLYSETKKARSEVQANINQALSYIERAIPALQNYQAALLRQSEILSALSNCNKAFVCAYDPLHEQVFGSPTFWKYLKGIRKNQALFKMDDFRKKLQHLILVSSQYNKINQSKV